jgi:hypothetical protein
VNLKNLADWISKKEGIKSQREDSNRQKVPYLLSLGQMAAS